MADLYFVPYSLKTSESQSGVLQVKMYPTRPSITERKRRSKPSSIHQQQKNIKASKDQFYNLLMNNFYIGDYLIDFTYSPFLTIAERISKRKYLLKTKLPNAYSKHNSEFKYLGVSGLGEKEKQFHDHILLSKINDIRTEDEVRCFLREHTVDGVNIHTSIIKPQRDETVLDTLEAIFNY